MPEVTQHTPGTFCWPELSTTDQKGAVTFYRALFGWEVNDQPAGPNDVYSMFEIGGKPVGAGSSLRPEERQHGVPSHWNVYVSVANADEAARRAGELGGKILAPPFDVMDVGRMAVLQDPGGAVFCVWQPKQHIGAMIIREPNTLCWTELLTGDTAAAEKFYTHLFGWTAKKGAAAPHEYTEFAVAGTPDAGMMPLDPAWGPVPPHWLSYFQVVDCDKAAARAKDLGGRVLTPPADIPNVGRFALVQDPQGATFGLFTRRR